MHHLLNEFVLLLGLDRSSSLRERLLSGLGGFIGIALILWISQLSNNVTHPLIIASMGASAVLLFAVPHGALSQPWPLLGGHFFSAIIGVSCAMALGDTLLSSALAVGIAITAMYSLRCLHPPGGATALTAVIGGTEIHQLGFSYVFNPIMLNAVGILVVAILFNYAYQHRRYPAHLGRVKVSEMPLEAAHLISALKKIDTFIDVSDEDLMQIYQVANQEANRGLDPKDIKLGSYYSNGKYGREWSIRQVVDESGEPGENDQVIYKVVAGMNRRTTGMVSREEFAQWAKYAMARDDENWKRIPN